MNGHGFSSYISRGSRLLRDLQCWIGIAYSSRKQNSQSKFTRDLNRGVEDSLAAFPNALSTELRDKATTNWFCNQQLFCTMMVEASPCLLLYCNAMIHRRKFNLLLVYMCLQKYCYLRNAGLRTVRIVVLVVVGSSWEGPFLLSLDFGFTCILTSGRAGSSSSPDFSPPLLRGFMNSLQGGIQQWVRVSFFGASISKFICCTNLHGCINWCISIWPLTASLQYLITDRSEMLRLIFSVQSSIFVQCNNCTHFEFTSRSRCSAPNHIQEIHTKCVCLSYIPCVHFCNVQCILLHFTSIPSLQECLPISWSLQELCPVIWSTPVWCPLLPKLRNFNCSNGCIFVATRQSYKNFFNVSSKNGIFRKKIISLLYFDCLT